MDRVPVKNMITLVDLGADYCMPCRLMMPMLKQLKHDYKGRAAIVYLDIQEHPATARRFGIRAVPTQILFDAKGKEVGRHEGYLDRETIVRALTEMGVKPPKGASAPKRP